MFVSCDIEHRAVLVYTRQHIHTLPIAAEDFWGEWYKMLLCCVCWLVLIAVTVCTAKVCARGRVRPASEKSFLQNITDNEL
jgi:hypothetical protein